MYIQYVGSDLAACGNLWLTIVFTATANGQGARLATEYQNLGVSMEFLCRTPISTFSIASATNFVTMV